MTRLKRHAFTLAMLLGVAAGLQVMRLFPPPPVFSEQHGRITHFQSYENNYFASLRSFTHHVARVVEVGRIPVIVLGDSSFRGTGATGGNVWTARLQQHVKSINPALHVINFSQNAGDLIAPYFFYHLQALFPQALFVVQWNYTNSAMERHPFTYWLTSEIILRDWHSSPAVDIGLKRMPLRSAEWPTIIMAAVNIAAPYLDLGNYLRYWALGYLSISAEHNPTVTPLMDAPDTELDWFKFTPRNDVRWNATMREVYRNMMDELDKVALRTSGEMKQFFDGYYPPAYRRRLLLVTVDLNPHFAPDAEPLALARRIRDWQLLRESVTAVPDLHWTSLIADSDELSENDYVDLGHLNVRGQARLAQTVAAALAGMPAARQRGSDQTSMR
jgi:hypothetical protein